MEIQCQTTSDITCAAVWSGNKLWSFLKRHNAQKLKAKFSIQYTKIKIERPRLHLRSRRNTCGAPGPPIPAKWTGKAVMRKLFLRKNQQATPPWNELIRHLQTVYTNKNIQKPKINKNISYMNHFKIKKPISRLIDLHTSTWSRRLEWKICLLEKLVDNLQDVVRCLAGLPESDHITGESAKHLIYVFVRVPWPEARNRGLPDDTLDKVMDKLWQLHSTSNLFQT